MNTTLLTDADFNVLITDDHLLEATGGDNTIWATAELVAWSLIVSYLKVRFDCEIIRQNIVSYPLIRQILLDIMIYDVVSRLTPKHVPEIRAIRYEQRIDWLTKAKDSEIQPDLPTYLDAEGMDISPKTYIGGEPAQDWYY